MNVESARVAVFIDWQNTYKTAREAFGWRDYPNEYGNYSPYLLARLLAARNDRGAEAQLVRVNIHRGSLAQVRRGRLRGKPPPGCRLDQGES